MRKFYTILLALFLGMTAVHAQHDVTIHVTDAMSSLPIENAFVSFDNMFMDTDVNGNVTFTGVPDGDYSYSVSYTCYDLGTGLVSVSGADFTEEAMINPLSTNSVFFFIGSPFGELDVLVELIGNDGYYSSFITTEFFGGESIGDVPFGEYTYVLSKSCHATVSGTIIVECNNGDGIAIFDQPTPATSNNVFFFIGELLAELDVYVELIGPDGYYASFTTSDPWGAEMIADVPFGEYTYILSKSCHTTVSGTVMVDCNNGDGIAIFDQPEPITLDATVSQDLNVLTANQAGSSYQWVDCDNGNAEIAGADSQEFTATANGNYAVMITLDDCTVTSDCIEVTSLGLSESNAIAFEYYPNPVQEFLTINLEKEHGKVNIQIHDLNGRLVLNDNQMALQNFRMDLSELESGMYILTIIAENHRSNVPVVIQR